MAPQAFGLVAPQSRSVSGDGILAGTPRLVLYTGIGMVARHDRLEVIRDSLTDGSDVAGPVRSGQ